MREQQPSDTMRRLFPAVQCDRVGACGDEFVRMRVRVRIETLLSRDDRRHSREVACSLAQPLSAYNDPSDLDPSDLDPSDLDPSDLDPSDLDPSDLV